MSQSVVVALYDENIITSICQVPWGYWYNNYTSIMGATKSFLIKASSTGRNSHLVLQSLGQRTVAEEVIGSGWKDMVIIL